MAQGQRSEEKVNYLPTPEEIRQGCLKIRKTWSPEETERRRVGRPATERSVNPATWRPPFIRLQDLDG